MIKFEIEDRIIDVEVPKGTPHEDFYDFIVDLYAMYGLDNYTYHIRQEFDLFETLSQSFKPKNMKP